ncbi:MAG: redoxin family protein [Planctomycetes bacterium]|nr:redoxin family protein [Planctomycetota bacterium]
MRRFGYVCAATLLCVAGAAWAQTPPATAPSEPSSRPTGAEKAKAEEPLPARLNVGDKAPALSIEKWVQGGEIKGFEKDHFYVVEFWATWCPPCLKSIPHLSELQKQYKDKGLSVVGVTSQDENGNTLEAVQEMIKTQGEKMSYTVAWDKGRATGRAYMEAARQGGIPTAFVVDRDGTIAWIGHPLEMDEPLEQILAGKFDRKAFAAKFAKQQDQVEIEMTLQKDLEPLDELIQGHKVDEAIKLVDGLFAKRPQAAEQLAMIKFQILLMIARDQKKAFEWAAEAEKHLTSSQTMNEIAWVILDFKDAPGRDLDLAMRLAEKASKLDPEDPGVLDTLARAYFEKKEPAKAFETQKKAIELARKAKLEDENIDELTARLKQYEEAAKK